MKRILRLAALCPLVLLGLGCSESEDIESVIDARVAEERCSIHGELLQEDKVRVSYGLLQVYFFRLSSEFPYANVFFEGGCIVGTKRWALVSYCTSCRKGYETMRPTYEREWEELGDGG